MAQRVRTLILPLTLAFLGCGDLLGVDWGNAHLAADGGATDDGGHVLDSSVSGSSSGASGSGSGGSSGGSSGSVARSSSPPPLLRRRPNSGRRRWTRSVPT